MRAVARAQDARLGRWLGRVGWYGPGVLSFVPPIRHRRDSDAIAATQRQDAIAATVVRTGAAAASRSSNCSTAARSPRASRRSRWKKSRSSSRRSTPSRTTAPGRCLLIHGSEAASLHVFESRRWRDGPATVYSLHGGGVSRTRRRAATRLDSPRRTVRDHAHATAALPQATTTAGAPSARARRWRRSRPPASSSGSGTRARPSSGSTPSLRRPRLLLSWLTTTTTRPTPWRPVWKWIRVDGVNFAVHAGGVGPVARRRPRRGLGPLGAHAADVVASHRSGRPRGSLAVAPSRPGVLSFFRGGVPVTERSQGRGLRAWGLLDPINTPSPRQSYSHRGPRGAATRGRAVRRHARARRSFAASAFQLRGVIARLLPPRRYSVERILAACSPRLPGRDGFAAGGKA